MGMCCTDLWGTRWLMSSPVGDEGQGGQFGDKVVRTRRLPLAAVFHNIIWLWQFKMQIKWKWLILYLHIVYCGTSHNVHHHIRRSHHGNCFHSLWYGTGTCHTHNLLDPHTRCHFASDMMLAGSAHLYCQWSIRRIDQRSLHCSWIEISLERAIKYKIGK